jgi:hypothetical protein
VPKEKIKLKILYTFHPGFEVQPQLEEQGWSTNVSDVTPGHSMTIEATKIIKVQTCEHRDWEVIASSSRDAPIKNVLSCPDCGATKTVWVSRGTGRSDDMIRLPKFLDS